MKPMLCRLVRRFPTLIKICQRDISTVIFIYIPVTVNIVIQQDQKQLDKKDLSRYF